MLKQCHLMAFPYSQGASPTTSPKEVSFYQTCSWPSRVLCLKEEDALA